MPVSEKGFTPLDNAFFEALIRFPFSKRQCKVLLGVLRKTIGFNKPADDISASQLAAMTGVARSHVCLTVNELVGLNVLGKQPGRYGQRLAINLDYRNWCWPEANDAGDATDAVTAALPKQYRHCYRNSNEAVTAAVQTTDIHQNTNTNRQPQSNSQSRAGGSGVSVEFPKVMQGRELQEARRLLAGIDLQSAQAMVDVLAVTIEAGEIRKSRLAVLSGLVRRFREGRFDPTPGLHLTEQRQRHAQRQQAEQQRARAYQQALLQRSANNEAQGNGIADVRAALKRRHSSG